MTLTVYNPPTSSLLPSHADNDAQLVTLWLHSKRSAHTRRAYQADAERFLAAVGKPLRSVTMADLQAFAETLANQAPNTQKRALAAVKSLLTFGQKVGYLQFNIGSAVPLASPKNALAERILSEAQVQKMLALETNKRNHALLLLLYAGGLRVSELCNVH